MANKPLQSIQFPGLPDKYTVPQMDSTFAGVTGQIPDSKKVKDEISELNTHLTNLDSHFVEGINLFNPNDPDIVENVELKNGGSTSEKTGFFASGYIPVIPGATICVHYPTGTYGSASSLVTYDENKNRIGYTVSGVERLTDANNKQYIKYTFASDTQAKYFRCTGAMAGYNYYMYVYASEMPSTYEAYTEDVTLADDVKADFANNIINVSIHKTDTDFIKVNPKNLVDIDAMVTGIIENSSNGGDLDSTVTTWVSTDYIPVKPNTTYSLYVAFGVYYGANYKGVPYYDKNKAFLGRIVPNGGRSANRMLDSITTPNNNAVAYIRNSCPIASKNTPKQRYYTMIVEGSWIGNAYLPYDGEYRLQGAGLSSEFAQPFNCLYGKLALWNGDSICAADNDTQGGWGMRIASANGMQVRNYGIAGGTIAENTGSGVHSVSATLDGMLTDFPNADYIIIEGGTNDADILGNSGLGTFDADDFSDEYIDALDKDTYSGALESIFYRLVTTMKGKHIGFLIPQKMGHTEVLVVRRRQYFDRAIEICRKWGIPYLDLWNDFYFNWRLSAHWDQTMTSADNESAGNLYQDGQHLTTTGYAIQSPIIAEWMKRI